MYNHRPLNILLINLPSSGSYTGFAGATYFPLGIGYIASVLKKSHHYVKVVDLQSDQALGRLNTAYLQDLISKHDYDLLGLGGIFFFISTLKHVVAFSQKIHPNAPIVLGGNFATINYRLFLDEIPQIDMVVLGEGEATIMDIIDNLDDKKSWKDIAGIAFNDNEIIVTKKREPVYDLDKIPFPARELLPFDVQYKKAFFQDGPARYCANLLGSRGCPFHCTFCEPTFGRKPRVRSADNILEEIDFLIKKYNAKYFRFYDEMFMGGIKNKIYDLCSKIIDNRLPIFWWCMTNGNLIDRDTLRLMKEAGCINMSLGVESASKTILKEMDKHCNLEHHRELVKYCNRIGIRGSLAWLTGTFSETDVTLEESKKYFLDVNRYQYQPTLLHKIIPLPGTRLFEEAISRGKITISRFDYLMSFEEIDAYKEDSWESIPNLTNMESREFNTRVAKIKNELIKNHRKQYTVFRKILSIFGLDHINWKAALKNFSINDMRPLLEAVIWSILNRKNKILRSVCEIIIYGKLSNSVALKCEKDSTR